MTTESTLLAGLVVALFLAGFLLYAMGELMVAGGVFLLATFVIYVRETRV